MNAKEIIHEAILLPLEERALVIDSLLRSLHQTEFEIDKEWVEVAKRRSDELKSKSVEAVPEQQVFDEIWQRFDGQVRNEP